MQAGEKFSIFCKETELEVEWLSINGASVFRVLVLNQQPLLLTRAAKEDGKKFWTSIPEGRQAEAELIGPLIEAWYRSRQ